MKVGKILGLIVGGVLVLAALLLFSAWLFINPNSYKPRIVAAVRNATGRELALTGDVKLSVFPWIALQLGAASLSNPPGFGDQPFVSFKRATFRARLLPLLAKRLEIGRIEIDGLDARFVRNADGKGNWEDFGKPAAASAGSAGTSTGGSTATSTSTAASTAGSTPSSAAGVTSGSTADDAGTGQTFAGIAGVTITNARVSYGEYSIENLNIETGAFARDELMPVAITFDANRGVATEHASVDAKLDFRGDLAAKRYHIAALTLHGTVNLIDNPRPVRWEFSTPALDLNLAAQTLSAPAFTLDLAGAQLSGSLVGDKIIDAPELSGKLSLAPLVVREFLPRLGMTAPRTRDPRALSLVTAAFAYGYGANSAKLDDLQVTVDDTHVKGSMALVDLQTQALKFALAVDAIDLDRYLPPAGAPTEAKAPAAMSAATAASGGKAKPVDANARKGMVASGNEAKPVDANATKATVGSDKEAESVNASARKATVASGKEAKSLEANGSLTVGSVHFAPLNLTAVKVTVAATGGVIHLFPLQALVAGGQYSGNIVLDSGGGRDDRDGQDRDSGNGRDDRGGQDRDNRYGRDDRGGRAGSVLTLDEHLTGIDVGKLVSTGSNVHVSGRGNVTLRATGRGADADAMLKSLSGHFDAAVANGAVEGIDVGFQLGRAEALLRRQDQPNVPDTQRTKFDVLKMSADIANGVAQTKDLTISSPVLKVTGQGSIDLPTRAIDLALLADTLRTAGGTPIQIPIKVTGSTADPTVRPDLEALAKGQLRQKVQEVLKDKLKELFNR